MPWARLDDRFYSHPKVANLGSSMLACVGLHALALSWCSAHLTDGIIPKDQVPRLCGDLSLLLPEGNPWGLVERLIAVNLWEEIDGNRYLIHDFLKYNPSRRQIIKERKKTEIRVNRWRHRNAAGNAAGNAITTPLPTVLPIPIPIPIKNIEKKEKEVDASPKDWSLPEELAKPLERTRFAFLRTDGPFWLSQFRAFPGVDFRSQLLRAEAWCAANPGKAPKKDLRRFLHTWFSRSPLREGEGE